MLDRDTMRKLLQVPDLPTLPEVVSRILDSVENEGSSANDLTGILECDAPISARILRLANSAFYGLRYPVDTIRSAVVIIGFDTVRLLALATSVFDTLSAHEGLGLNTQDFWLHSLGAAKAARLLAEPAHVPSTPGACFTAALLHDIGKCILALSMTDRYREVCQLAKSSQRHLHDVEREVLNMTHAEVGGWVAERWRFPSMIVDTIRNSPNALKYEGPNSQEVALVALSDTLSCLAEFGAAGDFGVCRISASLLRRLGLSDDTVAQALEQMVQTREETTQLIMVLGKA